MNLFSDTEALIYAIQAHSGHFRRNSRLPYIIHPIRVVDHLRHTKYSSSTFMIMSGYLHDVLEDTGYTLENFPEEVQIMVKYLTKGEKESKVDAVNKLLEAPSYLQPELLLIKLADRYDNCFGDVGDFRERYIKREDVIESTRLLLKYAKFENLDDEIIYDSLYRLFKHTN